MDALMPDAKHLGLLTDLYELTMAAGYWANGMAERRATFELFVRHLPEHRSYLVAAGLEQAVDYLVQLRFSGEDVDYLRGLAAFEHVPREWFEALRELRFTGDVWATAEGTVVFPDEPLVRVTGPIMEAQIVETFLLTSIAFQTTVASKAARVVQAAAGRAVVDFGARRAHGPQAGLLAARAAFVGGCQGTSNVLAAKRLGIPAVGTMAHSWVMAFEDETESFARYAKFFPNNSTLLIDTYDTAEGARRAARCGARPQAVRLDSGDLGALAREVRQILDAAGLGETRIFASGDLNEHKIDALVRGGAPIDAFGVGTELVTSKDAPALGVVYKLVEVTDERGRAMGRLKLSAEKKTYPHAKQVFRRYDATGALQEDVLGLADERLEGEALVEPVLVGGKCVRPLPSLSAIQARCQEQIKRLPRELLELEGAKRLSVRPSEALVARTDELARRHGGGGAGPG